MLVAGYLMAMVGVISVADVIVVWVVMVESFPSPPPTHTLPSTTKAQSDTHSSLPLPHPLTRSPIFAPPLSFHFQLSINLPSLFPFLFPHRLFFPPLSFPLPPRPLHIPSFIFNDLPLLHCVPLLIPLPRSLSVHYVFPSSFHYLPFPFSVTEAVRDSPSAMRGASLAELITGLFLLVFLIIIILFFLFQFFLFSHFLSLIFAFSVPYCLLSLFCFPFS